MSNEISFVHLKIDLEPTLNLGNMGVTPVAIYSTLGFDATTINPATVTLTGNVSNSPTHCSVRSSNSDLNGDGKIDTKLFFDTPCLKDFLIIDDTVVTLKGKTYSDSEYGEVDVSGSDTVRIIK